MGRIYFRNLKEKYLVSGTGTYQHNMLISCSLPAIADFWCSLSVSSRSPQNFFQKTVGGAKTS